MYAVSKVFLLIGFCYARSRQHYWGWGDFVDDRYYGIEINHEFVLAEVRQSFDSNTDLIDVQNLV